MRITYLDDTAATRVLMVKLRMMFREGSIPDPGPGYRICDVTDRCGKCRVLVHTSITPNGKFLHYRVYQIQ